MKSTGFDKRPLTIFQTDTLPNFRRRQIISQKRKHEAIPFLSYIPEAVRKKIYGYVIIVAFAVNSLLPFVLQLLKFHYNVGLSMPVAGG